MAFLTVTTWSFYRLFEPAKLKYMLKVYSYEDTVKLILCMVS